MSTRKFCYLSLITALFLFLSACGNKGDLYRPEPQPTKSPQSGTIHDNETSQ